MFIIISPNVSFKFKHFDSNYEYHSHHQKKSFPLMNCKQDRQALVYDFVHIKHTFDETLNALEYDNKRWKEDEKNLLKENNKNIKMSVTFYTLITCHSVNVNFWAIILHVEILVFYVRVDNVNMNADIIVKEKQTIEE